MLQSSWTRCWQGLNAQGDGRALMQRLLSAHGEPQRQYHTLQHLDECLQLLEQNLDLAWEPAEIEIALWFHDAVYDVKGKDNEERSAAWCAAELLRAGVTAEKVERIGRHILATRHAALPEAGDQALLVDIDLSILAAPRARFDEYEAQVRAEYHWVPGFIFRHKRRGLLRELLARESLYNVPRLRAALETRARINLAYSLNNLA